MEPDIYQQRWHKLRDGKMDSEAFMHLSRQIAFSFIDRYFQRGLYVPAYIDLLCEMGTFHAKGETDNLAAAALFGIVVEKLCDDFEELPVELYSRVMCQIISFCRTVPAGRALNETLIGFGITSPEQLYERAMLTHTKAYRYDSRNAPSRIVLLSRVTIGADVAILSVMIQRLQRLFPQANFVVIGNNKLGGLFEGNPRVRLRTLNYARRGGLFERFAGWHAAMQILRDEMPQDGEQSMLVIDPDSRISQLGVLPLLHGKNYLFFNTRNHTASTRGRCMAERTNDWMDKVFGDSGFCHPTVWTAPATLETARMRVDGLRAAGAKHIIAVNFGVGQNPRKRIGLEFEKRLVRALAAVPDTVVLLDRGFGPDETERSWQIMADVRHCGLPCLETRFSATNFPAIPHGVLVVECGIAEVAALIAHSDEYIGYDSACQHVAAAVKTPTLTVFAGSNNMNFVRRWSACGDTDCRIVHVNTLTDPQHVDIDEVIMRITQERASRSPANPQQRIHEIRRDKRKRVSAQESAIQSE